MAVIIAPPPLSNLNTVFFFEKKTLKFYTKNTKKRHMICYETTLWINIYRQIQNGGHDRPYRVLIHKGYCLAAIKGLL